MNLIDGYLNMRSLSKNDFIDESITWNNDGLIAVVCDNQEDAIATLHDPLVDRNNLEGRDLRIFDANEGRMIVYNNQPDAIPEFSDHIFDWMWLADKKGWTPPINVIDVISYEFIRKNSADDEYYGLFFLKLPSNIKGIDWIASQIAMDYTNSSNLYHINLKKQLSKYYIYDQNTDVIYDFKTFTRSLQ